MALPDEPRHRLLIAFALAAITLCLYWPVHTHEFIELDDPGYVAENPQVRAGLSLHGLIWAFTQSHSANWHPVTWLSHMVDCQVFGDRPGPQHVVNVLIHIANTVILFLLLQRSTGAQWRSALVAALFAWHPLHVESVAWIAERKDVLSGFFFLLTIRAYIEYATSRPVDYDRARRWYLGAIFLFALGLMSKPMLVTTPLVLFLVDYWPLRRVSDPRNLLTRPLVLEKLPFLVLSLLGCVLTVWAQSKGHAIVSVQKLSLFHRATDGLAGYFLYLFKTIWPVNLSIFYPLPAAPPVVAGLAGMLVLLALAVIAVKTARTRPYLLVGGCWFAGMLVPVIGLVQVGRQWIADRYTYLPAIGLFVMVAWLAGDLANTTRRRGIVAAVLLSLATCVVLSARQISFWKNDHTLFSHAVEVNPSDFIAWDNVGKTFEFAGDLAEATRCYRQALSIAPADSDARLNLAIALEKAGDHGGAVENFKRVIAADPDYMRAHNDYATTLIEQGHLDEAEAELNKAAQLAPDSLAPQLNRGVLLQKQNRMDDAFALYRSILKNDPTYDPAWVGLGGVYTVMDQTDEAITCYRAALRLNPDSVPAGIGLGESALDKHDFNEAEKVFSSVLRHAPENAIALDGLGFALAGQNRYGPAREQFLKAIRRDPGNADIHMHYAMCAEAMHRPAEAIAEYQRAIALDDHLLKAMNNLAWILATSDEADLRNGRRAVELSENACRLTGQRHPVYLATLAAAYAEAGRFDDAIATAEKAKSIALAAGRQDAARSLDPFIDTYKAGRPFHQANRP